MESEYLAYVYDGTLEGLLTSVFHAYEYREDPIDVVAERLFRPRLDQEVRVIKTDVALATRVRSGLIATCGYAAYRAVGAVSLSDEEDAGRATLRFIRYAMKIGPRCLDDILHPEVERFEEIRHFVMGERYQMMQFLRFREVDGGVYVATCSPKASVVPLLMGYLVKRFGFQPFLVYDRRHNVAGVYDGRSWRLVETDTFTVPPDTENEALMSKAWKTFYDAISVEARYNPELRRNNMPVRFWDDLTELREESHAGNRDNSALAPRLL